MEMMSHFGIRQVLSFCHLIGLLYAGYWRQETAETTGREHFHMGMKSGILAWPPPFVQYFRLRAARVEMAVRVPLFLPPNVLQ
jgi:hypothetical protein